MKLSLSLAIAVSFLASLAAAAPAAEPDVALVELEKRATRPIVLDTSFNCDDNRHCIFLGNGAALRPPFSGARCVDTNERGRGISESLPPHPADPGRTDPLPLCRPLPSVDGIPRFGRLPQR